ncbi:MAG: squalene synthase HpnC [Chloroherpetonaceae bacterium]|nr:squalene synthase HpnC [Chthonomonadaceae bacterium]MDW8209400.1 squalene synthase HpnC [Chloroherpetonaceae bacterium]
MGEARRNPALEGPAMIPHTQYTQPEIDHPYRVTRPVSREEARRYCARLAHTHYENFLVAGLFCPKPLRQHFYNIYAYCRISDDLGDEIGDPRKSLMLLDWWEAELDAMYRGQPQHPVFVALSETVEQFHIPPDPFRNLLRAFRQDQVQSRYATYADLLAYCVYSANPVGHLVLYLCGYDDAGMRALADKTCTALQLANFWQDVSRDLDKNRIYIPQEDLQRFGVTEAQLVARRFSPEYARLIRFEVERTYPLFEAGKSLGALVDRRVRLDIEMFTQGGLEVLRRIEQQGYDTLTRRPAIPKSRQMVLLLRRLLQIG